MFCNSKLKMIKLLLCVLPGYESRYVIPLIHNDPFCIALCTLLNLLVVPVVWLFLDKINPFLLRIDFYRQIYEKIKRKVERKRKLVEKYGYLGLILLIIIPLPATGVYTATFLSWLLNLDRKRAFISIAIATVIVNLAILLLTKSVLYLLSI